MKTPAAVVGVGEVHADRRMPQADFIRQRVRHRPLFPAHVLGRAEFVDYLCFGQLGVTLLLLGAGAHETGRTHRIGLVISAINDTLSSAVTRVRLRYRWSTGVGIRNVEESFVHTAITIAWRSSNHG